MVKHIVFFKLTSYENNIEKEQQLRGIEQAFLAIPDNLDYIVEYRVCRNIAEADHAWDIIIDSTFHCTDDIIRYQESGPHIEAVREASEIKKLKAVIDYEYLTDDRTVPHKI